ncbi:MAG: NAD(P)-dependent oxidoreductase [Chloroflexi bacterium]|nr:NAD(P)-dependent oxidoreductase [Chloroflexota bacterium]
MSVLVTGGNGSIGSMVCHELLRRGETVIAFDASPSTFGTPAWTSVQGDVLDAAGLREAIRHHKADRVVHLAVVLPTQEQHQPRRAFEVNTIGTLNLIEACLAEGVRRLVFTSSKGALGIIDPPHAPPEFAPVDETYRRRPVLIYDISKAACEDLLAYYRRYQGLDYVTLRFPTLYGPDRLARHGDLALVSKILEGARAGVPVSVAAEGWADELLYTGDVARAIVLALACEEPGQRMYHIGTGVVSSLADVIDAVRELYPNADIQVKAGTPRDNRACRFDIGRARSELGWQPRYDLRGGLRAYDELLGEEPR